MDIWLDSVDIELITLANKLGILRGITTNPSIIKASGKRLEEIILKLLPIQKGPLSIQVLSNRAEEIIEQAELLRDFSERIIVKVPVTQEGLKAIYALSHLQLPIMATAIVTAYQALFACHAGALYLALYLSQIEKPQATVEQILFQIKTRGFETQTLAASIHSLDQVDLCLKLGVPAVTLSADLFQQMISDHPKTLHAIEKFRKETHEGVPSKLLFP